MGKFDKPTFPTTDQGSNKKQPPKIGEKVKARIFPEDTLPEEVGGTFIEAGKRGRGQSHILSPEETAEEAKQMLAEVEKEREKRPWRDGIVRDPNKNKK